MARYTGPSTKVARKFGEPIFGPDKNFEHKNFPPGQHGLARKRKKLSMKRLETISMRRIKPKERL